MANATVDEILNAARALPSPDHGVSQTPQREVEMQWLSGHEAEFAGQWLALDGDRLIAHGPDAQQVYKAAFAAGVEAPFVVFAEDPQKPQWGGW